MILLFTLVGLFLLEWLLVTIVRKRAIAQGRTPTTKRFFLPIIVGGILVFGAIVVLQHR